MHSVRHCGPQRIHTPPPSNNAELYEYSLKWEPRGAKPPIELTGDTTSEGSDSGAHRRASDKKRGFMARWRSRRVSSEMPRTVLSDAMQLEQVRRFDSDGAESDDASGPSLMAQHHEASKLRTHALPFDDEPQPVIVVQKSGRLKKSKKASKKKK